MPNRIKTQHWMCKPVIKITARKRSAFRKAAALHIVCRYRHDHPVMGLSRF